MSSLDASLNASVASPQSQTSLELALEDAQALKDARSAYVTVLQPAAEADADIIGYVFAINGKLNSAEVYSSNGLFRKMWPKLLAASATEAIAARRGAAETLPSIEIAASFLATAEHGQPTSRKLSDKVELETRDGVGALYFETRSTDGRWVHRNYLAK